MLEKWIKIYEFGTHQLCKPRHFYNLSLLETMSDHNWQVFHPRGDLSLLTDTQHIFSFSIQSTVRLCWTLSHLSSPPNQTPNAVSIYQPCTHTQPNAMSPCICNTICHCLFVPCHIYYECYMDNLIKHAYH